MTVTRTNSHTDSFPAAPSRSRGAHRSKPRLLRVGLIVSATLAVSSGCSSGTAPDVAPSEVPFDLLALPLPDVNEPIPEGIGHTTTRAPDLANAELHAEGGSLVLWIENLTHSPGTLRLSALVENPTALHLTEDAANATIGPRQQLSIELTPSQVRGLDLENSEWTDARVNFELLLEDGRQDGASTRVFTEYGEVSEPREVVSSGVGIGLPELPEPQELPDSVDKQSTKIVCFSHVVQLAGNTENELDFVKSPNASIAAANLHMQVRQLPNGQRTDRTLDTAGCTTLPVGSWEATPQLTACNNAENYCWFAQKSDGTTPRRVVNVNTNVSGSVVSVPITMTGLEDSNLQKAYALATNTISRARTLGTGVVPVSNLTIRLAPEGSAASGYTHLSGSIIRIQGPDAGKRQTVAHEMGHWLHLGRFPNNTTNPVGGNIRTYCTNTSLTPCTPPPSDGCIRTATGNHSFDSLEWEGVAHIEGLANFFMFLAYNHRTPGANCRIPDVTCGSSTPAQRCFQDCEAEGEWLFRAATNNRACSEVASGLTTSVGNELDWAKMYWDFFADEQASLPTYLAVEAAVGFNEWNHTNHLEELEEEMSSSMRSAFRRAQAGNITQGAAH